MARARAFLRGAGLLPDPGTWLEGGRLLACAYPRGEAALASLARRGVSLLVNLHERAHEPARLARYGLTEVHLPVKDFSAPAPEQVARGVDGDGGDDDASRSAQRRRCLDDTALLRSGFGWRRRGGGRRRRPL